MQDAVHLAQSPSQRQRNENTDAVSEGGLHTRSQRVADTGRGLDNAGKTTIVKRIMHEDINSVSPTLGFIIKTIAYEG